MVCLASGSSMAGKSSLPNPKRCSTISMYPEFGSTPSAAYKAEQCGFARVGLRPRRSRGLHRNLARIGPPVAQVATTG